MKSAWMLAFAALAACAAQSAPAPAPMPAFITNGDVRLAFTLDVPPGKGPFPAVVLGHGSGRVVRANQQFLVDAWTKLGFAVLRFDKRGVGQSTGHFVFVGTHDSPVVFPELASDIEAGVKFLQTRPEIDRQRIGLSGWSQAGWILPLAAKTLGPDVRFMVIMSGPVCSVGLEMYYSEFAEGTDTPLTEVYPKMPGFHGESGFDPMPTLRAVNTPALWLLGRDDRSIPEHDTVANLKTLAASGKPFEWKEYAGLDHPLSDAIWPDVAAWVARVK